MKLIYKSVIVTLVVIMACSFLFSACGGEKGNNDNKDKTDDNSVAPIQENIEETSEYPLSK